MTSNKIVQDCKLLISRISKKQFNEVKTKIIQNKINAKTSKLQLNSILDLNSQDLELLNQILKNTDDVNSLPLILDLIYEIQTINKQNSNKTSLVWSGPILLHDYADNTSTTMISMIDSAKVSVTLLSYVMMENTRKIFDALMNATKRGISIKLAFNDGEKEKKKILKIWEKHVPLPTIYTFNPTKQGTSLHAKVLIIDSSEILATSANVTAHGINSNIELGIRHKGSVAKDAEKLIELLEKKKHLVKIYV